ncbi:MAG: von Willebrand factor type A domain-containing protein [Puniceicoccaceae bacterium]
MSLPPDFTQTDHSHSDLRLIRYLHGEIEDQDELTAIEIQLREDPTFRQKLDQLALADIELAGLFSRDPLLSHLPAVHRERIQALLKKHEQPNRLSILRFAPILLGGLAAGLLISAIILPSVGSSHSPLLHRLSQLNSTQPNIQTDNHSRTNDQGFLAPSSELRQINDRLESSLETLKLAESDSSGPLGRHIEIESSERGFSQITETSSGSASLADPFGDFGTMERSTRSLNEVASREDGRRQFDGDLFLGSSAPAPATPSRSSTPPPPPPAHQPRPASPPSDGYSNFEFRESSSKPRVQASPVSRVPQSTPEELFRSDRSQNYFTEAERAEESSLAANVVRSRISSELTLNESPAQNALPAIAGGADAAFAVEDLFKETSSLNDDSFELSAGLQPDPAFTFNPVSTFALNVSDQSFRLAYDSLLQNRLPAPHQIHPEEFLNAFAYRDPTPTVAQKIGLQWDLAEDPFSPGGYLLRLNVQTAGLGDRDQGKLNLILLADNSGSMQSPERTALLHDFVRDLHQSLPPASRVELRSIDNQHAIPIAPQSEASELPRLLSRIKLQAGSQTNFTESLLLAFDHLTSLQEPQTSQRVLALTDGLGIIEPAELPLLREQIVAAAARGISLDLVLINPEPSTGLIFDDLLRGLDGSLVSIYPSTRDTLDIARHLAGRFQPSARNAKVQVVFNPAQVLAYQLIGYEKHLLREEDFRDDTIDGGELAAAEEGNALYTLQLKPDGVGPISEVRVRFEDTDTGMVREKAWEIPLSGPPPPLTEASPAIQLATASTFFANRLQNRVDPSQVPLSKVDSLARANYQTFSNDPQFQQLLTMIRTTRNLLSE